MNATLASLRRTALALSVLAAFCASNAIAASPADPFVVAHTARLRSGDAVMGNVPASQPIHIEVVLKLRDRDGLDRFIDDNAKRPVQQVMSHDQFMANHAPTQAQAQAIAEYLGRMGYRNIAIASNRLLVSADGTAATANRAFMTNFVQVKTHDGRMAFMNTSEVLVPAALQEHVLSVLGLQTVNELHVVGLGSPQGVHANGVVPYNPRNFSSIYGGTGVATGAGVPVGLFVNGKVSGTLTDLAAFATNNGLSKIATSVVPTNGGGGSDSSGQVVWDTDSQAIVGMAGGFVGKLIFYTIPNLSDANVVANFNTIVSANATKIIDVSLAACETDAHASGLAASTDEILASGVAQGQTFAVAAGDTGADACGDGPDSVNWPAASQYAIAVGGTTLDASTTTWAQESAWRHTGGGPSAFEPQPSWQTGNVPSPNFRSVPDVAFDADPNTGASIVFDGETLTRGGTSLSASIFSGMWACVLATKGSSFGFAGPMLYRLRVFPSTRDIHDMYPGAGNNSTDIQDGYSATYNWDYVSGLGSLNLNTMIADIGNPGTGDTPVESSFSVYSVDGMQVTFRVATIKGTNPQGAYFDFEDGTPLSGFGAGSGLYPPHSFPGPGTYNVTLTVFDEHYLNPVSSSHAVTLTVPVTSYQKMRNTGFEDGTAPWTFSSPSLLSNIGPHSGQWDALLGGKGTQHTDSIKQLFATKDKSSALTLHFWLHVQTSETTTTAANDTLAVSVTNTNGGVLGTLHTYSNLDANPGYVEETLDLTPYKTQPNIIVRFVGTENASNQTSFFIDDVTVL